MPHTDAHPIPVPADTTFLPGPVLLFGAPGVGKGTQAQILMSEFGIPQISTGDLLRRNVADKSILGTRAKQLMDEGQLVPDALVNQMVNDRLTLPDTKRGFIFDGFPRTLEQAIWLDGHLVTGRQDFVWQDADGRPQKYLPVIAVSIIVDYDQLLHRITGRRTCPVCNSIYNVFSNPPKTAGICDLDGATLIQRTDDSEDVFTERMRTFYAQTAPVIDHYRAQHSLEEVDGDQPVEQVTAAITTALKRLRSDTPEVQA